MLRQPQMDKIKKSKKEKKTPSYIIFKLLKPKDRENYELKTMLHTNSRK